MKKLFCLFSMQILLFLLLLLSGCSKGYLDTLLTCGSGYVLTDKNIPDWDGLGVYCVLTNSDVQTLLVKDANGVVGEFVYNAADCAYNLDYTPEAGGFGVFGAQCKVEYDFSVYRQELKELYFDVIDKLEVKPPDKYDNPGLDYRW